MINPISMQEVGKARQTDVLRDANVRRQVEEAREFQKKTRKPLFSNLNFFKSKSSEARPGRLATEQ